MTMRRILFAQLIFLAALPVAAHHSFLAEFDPQKPFSFADTHEGRTHQPALVVYHRRDGSRWGGRELGDRGRNAEYPVQKRDHPRLVAGGDGDRRGRLPGHRRQ